MSEREFTAQVIELLVRLGWKVHHVFEAYHYARRTTKGYPDICAVKLNDDATSTRLLFAELKSSKGTLTIEQNEWLQVLAMAPGVECYLWREGEDTLERIVEVLNEGETVPLQNHIVPDPDSVPRM